MGVGLGAGRAAGKRVVSAQGPGEGAGVGGRTIGSYGAATSADDNEDEGDK